MSKNQNLVIIFILGPSSKIVNICTRIWSKFFPEVSSCYVPQYCAISLAWGDKMHILNSWPQQHVSVYRAFPHRCVCHQIENLSSFCFWKQAANDLAKLLITFHMRPSWLPYQPPHHSAKELPCHSTGRILLSYCVGYIAGTVSIINSIWQN